MQACYINSHILLFWCWLYQQYTKVGTWT